MTPYGDLVPTHMQLSTHLSQAIGSTLLHSELRALQTLENEYCVCYHVVQLSNRNMSYLSAQSVFSFHTIEHRPGFMIRKTSLVTAKGLPETRLYDCEIQAHQCDISHTLESSPLRLWACPDLARPVGRILTFERHRSLDSPTTRPH
jgi:hypothetical protein